MLNHSENAYDAGLFVYKTPSMLACNASRVKVVAANVDSAHHFSGASGNLSMTYLPRATLMMGTPGIFLIRLFKSRSFVATIYTLCFITRSTMQSSAYTPLWSHCRRSHRSSRAILRAMRYLGPSFSNSAMTQVVIIGRQDA